jgi:hypothetical protein
MKIVDWIKIHCTGQNILSINNGADALLRGEDAASRCSAKRPARISRTSSPDIDHSDTSRRTEDAKREERKGEGKRRVLLRTVRIATNSSRGENQ